jgi:hypothetical protein
MQKGGKSIPVEPGTRKPHWKRCKALRNAKRTQEIGQGARIVGTNYKPSCGQCRAEPWSECACSSLLKDFTAEKIHRELDERLQLLLID